MGHETLRTRKRGKTCPRDRVCEALGRRFVCFVYSKKQWILIFYNKTLKTTFNIGFFYDEYKQFAAFPAAPSAQDGEVRRKNGQRAKILRNTFQKVRQIRTGEMGCACWRQGFVEMGVVGHAGCLVDAFVYGV
jgi:hypothetical protein